MKYLLPVISFVAVATGSIVLNNDESMVFVATPLIVAGMIGCFVSIIKYRKS